VEIFFDQFTRKLGTLGQQALVGLFIGKSACRILPPSKSERPLEALVGQNADFIGQVALEFENLRGFNGLVALVFFSTLASEDFDVDDGAFNARRAVEGRIANVAGFFAEDGAQQFFLPASAWFRPWA